MLQKHNYITPRTRRQGSPRIGCIILRTTKYKAVKKDGGVEIEIGLEERLTFREYARVLILKRGNFPPLQIWKKIHAQKQ